MLSMKTVRTCVAVSGVPLVHPEGHPRAGQVVEFDLPVPGYYFLEFSVASSFVRFSVDVDEDGRARLVLVDKHVPDLSDPGALLSPLERELLDGLAEIIALDMLREKDPEVRARC